MTKTLLTLNNISKSYPKISQGKSRFSALTAAFLNRPYSETHDIIKAVSFTVKQGESLGIIGENGAGKSTLLKLISGVLRPTAGTIKLDCRVAALLELGAGFHPEYSGLDNLRMNAALSGLSRQALSMKMQHVIDFADIGEYIDEPIKYYSSGMVVRLGFAMMTALSPELLITDEVLAVGDESFQKKCITWLQQYLDDGGTLLICSHGMYHIQKLCTHALWLEQGKVKAYGQSSEVTQAYLNYHERKEKQESQAKISDNKLYHIKEAAVYDEQGEMVRYLKKGSDLTIKGTVYSPDGREPVVAIGINKVNGTAIFGTSNQMSGQRLKRLDAHLFSFTVSYPDCPLLPGEFLIKAHAMDTEGLRLFDTYEVLLTITGKNDALGTVYLEHEWKK